MSDYELTWDELWDELLVESGDAARWEARGRAEGEARGIAVGEARGIAVGEARGEEKKAAEIARNLLKNGFSVEQTALLSGMDVARVEALK